MRRRIEKIVAEVNSVERGNGGGERSDRGEARSGAAR